MTAMDRIGAFSGAAYFVLGNAAIAIGADRQLPDAPTGQESLDALGRMAANPAAQAAISIELLSFVAWMTFVGYVCWRLRAAGWLAAVALVAGIVELAVKLGSAGPLIAGYSLRDHMSPEQAAILTEINKADFFVGLLPAGLFVLFAAFAALKTQQLGRVLAWSGIAIGAANIITAAVIGVNIPESGFAPSFLLVLLWELVLSLRWGFAHTHPQVRAAINPANPVTS
ncbi:hypothetical protein [Arthrobacter sp. ISL-28]|uniref:hypothetical protein n=1 Tax=Arthrobacter sp. ISL-28 TaxID=2819108 RepID=UPI001BEA29B6|nr:hypothetical protein [Arthrobacter sp. ISL-28]MBT2523833.1 hypothetical protein [Arthrobacter sp. ISL-28]